jgi:hypothetical protein
MHLKVTNDLDIVMSALSAVLLTYFCNLKVIRSYK